MKTDENESARAEFQRSVMDRITNVIDPVDQVHVTGCIDQLHADGFTVSDAVDYVRCLEEVDPGLEEGIALARMQHIRTRYVKL